MKDDCLLTCYFTLPVQCEDSCGSTTRRSCSTSLWTASDVGGVSRALRPNLFSASFSSCWTIMSEKRGRGLTKGEEAKEAWASARSRMGLFRGAEECFQDCSFCLFCLSRGRFDALRLNVFLLSAAGRRVRLRPACVSLACAEAHVWRVGCWSWTSVGFVVLDLRGRRGCHWVWFSTSAVRCGGSTYSDEASHFWSAEQTAVECYY